MLNAVGSIWLDGLNGDTFIVIALSVYVVFSVLQVSYLHHFTSQVSKLNMIPTKRPVGRPKTGNALTPAEKQARYRARQAERSVTVTISRTDLPTLKSLLANVPEDLGLPAETIERLAKIVRDADERT